MRGEGRQPGGASIRLLARGEGWPTAAHGAARLGQRKEMTQGDGPNGPVRLNGPVWQLGWRRVSGQNQGFE
jgi:hypothetical protein